MASIDKIYVTKKQYFELKKWLQKNNKELLKYLYPLSIFAKEYRSDYNIASFPTWGDAFLFENCNLLWVINRIKAQYGNYYNKKDKTLNLTFDQMEFEIIKGVTNA